MIVRILGEGQYRLADGESERLNAVDDRVMAAAQAGDEDAFRIALGELVALVRAGDPVPAEELLPSDAVIPAPDADLVESERLLSDEGLIPG